MCPNTSGIISNILNAVADDGTLYPSGKVNQSVFQSLPLLNAMLGSTYSGTAQEGCIYPDISGTIYQGILELYVAKELTKKSLMTASRTYTLTSFKEGDSTVNIADSSKTLGLLYGHLTTEFDKMLNYAKYTLASQAPASINGADANIQESLPFIGYMGYPNYRPYES
jgi:hypothetical protein